MLPFLRLWGTKRLNEYAPWRVDAICQKVISVYSLTSNLFRLSSSSVVQNICKEGRGVKDVDIIQ